MTGLTLFVVRWRERKFDFAIVSDQLDDRLVPAAYLDRTDAEARAADMRRSFPHVEYEVAVYDPPGVRCEWPACDRSEP